MNKCEKIYRYATAVILILFIAIIFVMHMLLPDKTFSESENRILEKMPHFSFESITKGKFTSDYEKYISDQFPLRDFWVGIKSDAEKTLGKKENNGVYLGKDDYLLQKFNKPDMESLKEKISAVNSFAAAAPGVKKYIMIVPNSVRVLKDKLPENAPDADEIVYINKAKELLDKNINFVDAYSILNSKKDEYIYYKTDHHWTSKGAYYVYQNLIKDMGFIPYSKEHFDVKDVTDDFYGSLYSKSGYRHIAADSIELYTPKTTMKYKVEYIGENKTTDSIYNMDNLNKKDKYTVFLDGNHPLIKIKSNVKAHKKLLVIKDSYANSLIPFLCNHYSEIYMVDPRYYNENIGNLIKDNHIKNILIVYNALTFFEDSSVENIAY